MHTPIRRGSHAAPADPIACRRRPNGSMRRARGRRPPTASAATRSNSATTRDLPIWARLFSGGTRAAARLPPPGLSRREGSSPMPGVFSICTVTPGNGGGLLDTGCSQDAYRRNGLHTPRKLRDWRAAWWRLGGRIPEAEVRATDIRALGGAPLPRGLSGGAVARPLKGSPRAVQGLRAKAAHAFLRGARPCVALPCSAQGTPAREQRVAGAGPREPKWIPTSSSSGPARPG